jgi:hypothetical protein
VRIVRPAVPSAGQNTTAVRLSVLEQTVTRLADRRGGKVSDLLKLARQRSMAGEQVPPVLRDLGELERQAQGTGVSAAMAKAQLRMIRGLVPPSVGQDERGAGEGLGVSSSPARSTGAPGALAGQSVVDRIDQLLAAASARA